MIFDSGGCPRCYRRPKTKPGTTVVAMESQNRTASLSVPLNSINEPMQIQYLRTTSRGHAIAEYWDSGVISLGRKGGGGGLGRGAAESRSEDLLNWEEAQLALNHFVGSATASALIPRILGRSYQGHCMARCPNTTLNLDLKRMAEAQLQMLSDSINETRHTIVVNVGRWDNCSRKGPELHIVVDENRVNIT